MPKFKVERINRTSNDLIKSKCKLVYYYNLHCTSIKESPSTEFDSEISSSLNLNSIFESAALTLRCEIYKPNGLLNINSSVAYSNSVFVTFYEYDISEYEKT